MTAENESSEITEADLKACAREPIHIPSAIQPFGILLFVAGVDFHVRRAGRNASAIWPNVIGERLRDLFDASTSQRLVEWLPTTPEHPATVAEFDVATPDGERRYRPIAHRAKDGWILELEEVADESPASVAGVLHRAIDRLQDADSLESLYAAAAEEVRAVTGFDSVMIYRFDADWNGSVVAQSRADHMPSYAGHHFPASDIPEQARRLYTVNLSRLIVDVDYEPAPIEPPPADGERLDLTHSVLRSVSPVHIEYLQNMDVKASMSLSVVVDGRLWGLIACHHAEPRYVPVDMRVACELLARVMSMLVVSLREIAGRRHSARLASVHNKLLEAMLRHEDFANGLVKEGDALLGLADATGAALLRSGACTLIGNTPPEAQVLKIAQWLVESGRNEDTYSTEALGRQFEPASDLIATAAGLLAVPLSTYDASFLLWFRPELPRSIDWAGEPGKVIRVNGDREGRIRPRKSFETWTEIQRGRSKPWLSAERQAAGALRAAVTDVVMSRTEEVRRLNASLAELNEELVQRNRELRDMADITTHDLQEPLRKIRAFSDLLQKEEHPALSSDGLLYLERLSAAAKRMSALVSDMLSFSTVHIDARPFTRVNLNAELTAALNELRQMGVLEGVEVDADRLPFVEGDASQLRQLFRNLLDNAAKFRHDQRPSKITIQARKDHGRLHIEIADNGIGVEQRFVESIFEPFHQLHGRNRYEGTGMGLAVCRRIVQRHAGSITAESEIGEGTRILIDLPAGDVS